MVFLVDDSENTVARIRETKTEGSIYCCVVERLDICENTNRFSGKEPEAEKRAMIAAGFREIGPSAYFQYVAGILSTWQQMNEWEAAEYRQVNGELQPIVFSVAEIMEAA